MLALFLYSKPKTTSFLVAEVHAQSCPWLSMKHSLLKGSPSLGDISQSFFFCQHRGVNCCNLATMLNLFRVRVYPNKNMRVLFASRNHVDAKMSFHDTKSHLCDTGTTCASWCFPSSQESIFRTCWTGKLSARSGELSHVLYASLAQFAGFLCNLPFLHISTKSASCSISLLITC